MKFRRFLGFLLLAGMTACGVTPTLVTRGDLAETEFINRTHGDLIIAVRGRVEGTLASGHRLRVRHLTPGAALLEARIEEASPLNAKAGHFERRVTLRPGATETWAIGDALAPTDIVSTGRLAITNEVDRDLLVSMSGKPLGQVLAGDTRIFQELPAGDHHMQAVDRSLKTLLNHPLSITADETAVWKVREASGQLKVINDTEEPVDLVLEDSAIGRIRPHEARTFKGLGPGQHAIEGVSSVTRHRYQHRVEIRGGETSTWGLTTGSGRLSVRNHTDEKLTVVPRGSLVPARDRVIDVPARGARTVNNVLPGKLTLHAVGDREQILYSTQLRVRAGQHVYWDVWPRSATGRVINETEQRITIYVAGKRHGACGPGESMTLASLPGGEFVIKALGNDGATFERSVEAIPRAPFTWRVVPGTGVLRVTNKRNTSISVYRNAQFLGDVKPKRAIQFTGLPNGNSLIEWVDSGDGHVTRKRLNIEKGKVESLVAQDQRSFISVSNETGEPLQVPGGWSGQHEVIRPGQKAHFISGPGPRVLRLTGSMTGLRFFRSWKLAVGEHVHWQVLSPKGTIRVVNELNEPLELTVLPHPVVTISPGALHDFKSLDAGVHRLEARAVQSGRVYRENRRIQPDGRTIWRLAHETSRLLIKNHTQEELVVKLDGRPYGSVSANDAKVFGDLQPGTRKLRTTGARSASDRHFTLNLVGQKTEFVDVFPDRGTLVVENASGEDLDVYFDATKSWRLKVGSGPTELPIDAGTHLVRVRRRDSQRESLYKVNVTAWRSIHLRITRPSARLALKNDSTQTLVIWTGNRELGRLAAGEELISDTLPQGSIKLRAYDLQGRLTHVEDRRLQVGTTSTWRLR